MTKHVLFTVAAGLLAVTSFAQTTLILQPNATAGKDAEIFSCVPCGYNNSNYGNKQDFNAIAWTNGGNQSNVRSLIQFDLSGIPANATITSATLALYFNPSSPEGKHFQFLNSNSSYISRITSTWSENTVTWANQPTITSSNRVSLSGTSSSTQSFTNINMKQLIIDSRNNPSTSFGFMLKLQQEKSFRKLIFASSDHPTASLRPKLTIVYTVPVPLIANGNTGLTEEMNVFPNPLRGSTVLKLNAAKNDVANVTISDALGKTCAAFSNDIAEGYNEINLDATTLIPGIYIVTVRTSSKTFSKRIIVE